MIQELFLNTLRKEKIPVSMFLVSGIRLQGVITSFDRFSVQLCGPDSINSMVEKSAISTILPGRPVTLENNSKGA